MTADPPPAASTGPSLHVALGNTVRGGPKATCVLPLNLCSFLSSRQSRRKDGDKGVRQKVHVPHLPFGAWHTGSLDVVPCVLMIREAE